eukprot:TRINITY_DN11864_c0_g1_i1.p1 TRINITY_DN11864_c0_g1~~TRINITY_DN11864_c0_g1_i1.p1  ORF type:complete len:446 (+),score=100.30 TRINITY_DN11864_c0_g1_i1:57-1340(+)
MSSWISYEPHHPFPIQSIPFGVFSPRGDDKPRCATRIGDNVVDLAALATAGHFDSHTGLREALSQPTLNAFMAMGKPAWRAAREILQHLFSASEKSLQDDSDLRRTAILNVADVDMRLPCKIGDYTDFYASEEHATNLGKMFRPTAAPLLPNWKHIPIGYHGRASSVVVSGTPIRRPCGQTVAKDGDPPSFGPSQRVDFEVEVGFFIGGPENELGTRVSMKEAFDRVFGLVLFNDWSARDMQKWEYVPLGPFLGKSFGSTISPWIVTMDALEPFMLAPHAQDPVPLPYLRHPEGAKAAIDVTLQCDITPGGAGAETTPKTVSTTNLKYMYWSIFQQLTHHASNGCNMRAGDLLATGTISGPTEDSFGSMLELCWMGSKDVDVGAGQTRKFIRDGDVVTMRGECRTENYTIGFGEASGLLLPAKPVEE